jgi:hypothetical protein
LGERLTAVGMNAFCYKNQRDIGKRLEFAWSMHAAPGLVAKQARSAWESVAASISADCVCGGDWIPMTEQLLAIQSQSFLAATDQSEIPHSNALRQAICNALEQGCKKHANVFIYGPRSSGKSHVIEPLMKIFSGSAFTRPAGKSNYPLQDLFGKKVCVLQDLRVRTFALCFDALLVWWEGKAFRVPLPQNVHTGDGFYTEAAPVFATSGGKLRIPLAEAIAENVEPQMQNDMMDERFRYFHFPVGLSKAQIRLVEPCERCFATWLVSGPGVSPLPLSADPGTSLMPCHVPAGFADVMREAHIDAHVSNAFLREIAPLGAVDVRELLFSDWANLSAWLSLKPMELRRLSAVLFHA